MRILFAAGALILAAACSANDADHEPYLGPVPEDVTQLAQGGDIEGAGGQACIAPGTTYGSKLPFRHVITFYEDRGFKGRMWVSGLHWSAERGKDSFDQWRRINVFDSKDPDLLAGGPGTADLIRNWNTIITVVGCTEPYEQPT